MPRSAHIQSSLQRSPVTKARTRTNQLTSPTASSFKTPRTHIADVSKSSRVTPRVGLESKGKEARKSTARPAVPPPNCVPENPSVPRQLWLMKTDPDYMVCPPLANAPMVDKLVRDTETTWTGVRGYEARNLLRDHFHVGDQVLFYHSGDPKHMASLSAGQVKEPGIAAVCVVSKAAFPEVGAPLNSKGEVQWYSVGVRLVCTVDPQLSLQQLRAEPSLAGMDLFLRSRLSIQRVERSHWQHIMTMAGLQNSPLIQK